MNPLTNVRNLQKINERELELGLVGKKSWHDKYKDSAWIFVGGLPYDLTEGDIICVFSQYGEIVNINLVRDKQSGKSKGYGFLCYEDQRSTILSVDNLNGIKLLGRTIRVDHVEDYKQPKEFGDEDDMTKQLRQEGCAPGEGKSEEEEEDSFVLPKKQKKVKKEKKKKKKKEKKKSQSPGRHDTNSDSSVDDRRLSGLDNNQIIKKEKYRDTCNRDAYQDHRKHNNDRSNEGYRHTDIKRDRTSDYNDRNSLRRDRSPQRRDEDNRTHTSKRYREYDNTSHRHRDCSRYTDQDRSYSSDRKDSREKYRDTRW